MEGEIEPYLRALVFLLLRLSRRTRFFLHFALMVQQLGELRLSAKEAIEGVQASSWRQRMMCQVIEWVL